ncbi:hypothetical protein J2X75_005029 [Paenibacillus sp. 2003]|nr:hypothetical protein [Paenibacillus sp. 2003]
MQLYDKAPLAFGDNFGRGGQAVYSALGLRRSLNQIKSNK